VFYKDVSNLSPARFKRLIGVKREAFELMLEALTASKAVKRRHPSRGTPAKLSNADKLLLLLMYYREYRTQFHMGHYIWNIREPCL
jgi:hypothetical protein